MKYLVTFMYFWLFPLIAEASLKGYSHIGTSFIYSNINDDNYEFVNKYEEIKNPSFSGLNYGFTTEYKKLVIDISSNRLTNLDISRSVIHNKTRQTFLNKTKTTFDSLSIGTKFYDRIVGSVFLANTKINKRIYQDRSLLGKEVKHSILYGINFNYFVTRETSVSVLAIAPDQEFNLKFSLGFGVNFYF
jgi:hypothetical protein